MQLLGRFIKPEFNRSAIIITLLRSDDTIASIKMLNIFLIQLLQS